MIVAQEKRRENISEYLLYMWQVEDLIRAAGCEPQRIEELILPRYEVDEVQRAEILNWYLELAAMMRREGKREAGHLDVNRLVLLELEDLHRRLLANPNDYVYAGLHYQVLPAVIQLRSKSVGAEAGDVETCFNAIYGYLTLALKGDSVGEETKKSIQQMSTFLSMLAHKYKLEREQAVSEVSL
ncbi:MAG: DUF4924 family protein [Porphyromonadaceae bacterium]|nr:DUF4924 family protein [Porphyromonadaceae bacterium]